MTVRALTSGVTGLLNNQLALDVTANNLANVNTPGFKGSRVSFESSLVQTQFSGSAPGAQIGGQNPQQVGLGVSTASIDIDMSQGALQATGRDLDLAIQGEGFFELTDGTRSYFSRVGSFGLDSNANLVHLGTGYRLIGNTYNLDPNPDGSQTINQIGVPLEIPVGEAFPPSRTERITYQGNLSSATPALRGSSLTSLYQLRNALSGSAATEDTRLRDLTIFNGATGAPNTEVTMYVFGTKQNGETYGGEFTLHPWATPTSANSDGSVTELVSGLNDVLVHGNERFGTVRVENGNLVASGVGDGDGFSLFLGESNPMPVTYTPAGGALNGGEAYNGVADATPEDTHTIGVGESPGLLQTSFSVPAADFSAQGNANMRLAVRVNGEERGSVIVPAADYSGGGNTFRIPGFPHVEPGDTIEYFISGNLDVSGAGNVTWSTEIVDDYNVTNLTRDLYSPEGTGSNEVADIFDENSTADANAWQLLNNTNNTFDWYRSRMVPEFVSSSIEVFDAQGGRHTLESRFYRTGTKTEVGTDARINSWDCVVDIPFGDGQMIDDIVTGVEFDQDGRFTGSIGTTVHSTTLDANQYVGSPATANIQVDWATTGPTDPPTIAMDFGDNNSYTGLTSFGSDNTAAAVQQDGYADGKLDSLNVSAEGDVIALYTNGISRSLAQITLTSFRNPAGLNSVEGNLWSQTTNSGNPTRRTPGQNAGFITSGALESGNVDIATEFSRLITAQRGFQVSARVIQTTDAVLEELANLTR